MNSDPLSNVMLLNICENFFPKRGSILSSTVTTPVAEYLSSPIFKFAAFVFEVFTLTLFGDLHRTAFFSRQVGIQMRIVRFNSLYIVALWTGRRSAIAQGFKPFSIFMCSVQVKYLCILLSSSFRIRQKDGKRKWRPSPSL